jgi:kynurenine formamidase
MGTQLDGLGHVEIDKVHYNGVPLEDILDPKGAKKFGMEKVPPIVTRGVLLDMVAYKGRFLRGGEAITPADIEGCIEMEDVEIRPGDVVIFNTGWMRLWMKDNEKFLESEPGITVSTARYLAEKHVVAVGTDQWCTEVVPMEDPETLYPVHQELLAKNGIYLMQNLVTEKLAQDKVYEFFFVFTHPKIKGTVQGIGQPIAII